MRPVSTAATIAPAVARMSKFAWLLSTSIALSAAGAATPAPPSLLRVDLHLQEGGRESGPVFVTLDTITGVSVNVSFSWALPTTSVPVQAGARLLLSSPTSAIGTNVTVFDSGWVAGPAQSMQLSRHLLAPAMTYDWTVAVRGADGATSDWARPRRFFTNANAALWASSSAPVWPAPCASGGSPPSFARFHADIPLPQDRVVLSALLFVTGASPLYSDPWNVSKVLGGFALRVGGALIGVGPGKIPCGPYNMSKCAPAQPVDGFDISDAAAQAVSSGTPLVLDVTSYGLVQSDLGIAPAVQMLLVVRWSPSSAYSDTIIGTQPNAGPWTALDADGVVRPRGNKAPFWYTQPREDVDTRCLPSLPGVEPTAPANCSAVCGWAPPIAAPAAWDSHRRPLVGKATQALYVASGAMPVTVTPLGPGWFVLDSGGEFQGGVELVLAPGSAAPAGARVLVQLGSELAANGSVLWHTRAGNTYQDAWTFAPTTGSPRPETLSIAHHEFSEFRYAELVFADAMTGAPLDVNALSDFNATFWLVRYRADASTAAVVSTSSAELDAVYRFGATTLTTTTLDMYSDSNTRQRSLDCMADDTTAALSQYATTSELALPRMAAAQIWATMDGGYVSPNWADWTGAPV